MSGALDREGIKTLAQLVRYSREELKRISNIGFLSIQEIETKVGEIGLQLKP